MLYSIMEAPPDDTKREYYYVDIKGGRLSLIKKGEDTYEINSLISTDPKNYLNPLYTPGKLVRIKDLSELKK